MKDAEKCIVGNSESYGTFKSKLEKLPDNVVVIGSHTHTDNRKEKVIDPTSYACTNIFVFYDLFVCVFVCLSCSLLIFLP